VIDEHYRNPVSIRGDQIVVNGDVDLLEFEGQVFLEVASHTMNDVTKMAVGPRINNDTDRHLVYELNTEVWTEAWRYLPAYTVF
jgi:hypothetical protein